MKLRLLKILLAAFIAWAAATDAAAVVNVQAKLDSAYIFMGRSTDLHVTVTQPKGVKGAFPLLNQIRENGIIPVCGDSVELRTPSAIDTVDNGASLSIKYTIPVQAFDSGYYRLPELVFVAGNDSAAGKSLFLKVVPVNAKADDPINDYASVADPDGVSIFDWIPDWVIDFWWVILIVLLAVAAFIFAMRRYREQGSLLPRKPQPSPYEVAVERLRELKGRKLWEQGMEKEYYTDLTDILRTYLYGRFGINALEMTSREIMQSLKENKEISGHRPVMRQILDMADFVKFAKVRPLPGDCVKSYEYALQFVQDTKPVPAEQQENDGKDGKGGAK